MSDEGVAWPSFVDFLSAFVFVLMLFLASTVYIVSGAIEEHLAREHVEGVSGVLKDGGIANVVEGKLIRISLTNKVTFPLGGSTLDEAGKRYLREIGGRVTHQGLRRVIVEGHADKTEVKHDEFGNWRYSVERALTVLRFLYLCDDCGFDKNDLRSKLVLRGEGDLDAHTLAAPERLVGRPDDRRVDIVLDFGDERDR